MCNYWQIAAGSHGRDYSNEFLKFGMAFIGADPAINPMNEVNAGDIVVLKQGTSKIVAAGKVVRRAGIYKGYADKEWLRDFDGWDLPAYCYVDWTTPRNPVETSGLTRGTMRQLLQADPRNAADEILRTGNSCHTSPEPDATKMIDDNDLLRFLIKEGLRPSSADGLTNTIEKIRLLADYYYQHCEWEHIREHETRTFLVVPFLLALGWAEQQIKIELPCVGRKRIDIACFSRNYKGNNDRCVSIIETKGFASGLDYVQEQAAMYAQNFPDCRAIIVTNGYCYKIYLNDDGHYHITPSAYLNLLKPRNRYPLDPRNVGGALDTIKWLLPNNLIS